jgi:hypothetical protein
MTPAQVCLRVRPKIEVVRDSAGTGVVMQIRLKFVGALSVALLVVVAGCGVDFGLTPSDPLGTLSDMDKLLAGDKGLEKSQRKFTDPECFGHVRYEKLGKLKVYQYQDHNVNSTQKHWVLLGVDEAGKIKAVAGCFASGRKSFSDSGTKVEGLLGTLWAEINGGPAEFEKKNEPGIDVNEFLLATIEKGNVHGIWKKIPNSGLVSHHKTIWDMILIWVE